MKKKSGTLLTCLLLHLTGFAQQHFTEGVIVYKVRIEPAAGAAARETVTGDFELTLKERQLIKELSLSSGFRNRIVWNMADNTAYSLRRVQDKKYAIQLDAAELNKKQRACTTAIMEELPADGRIVSGYKALHKKVICGKGGPIQLYYTNEWELKEKNLFQHFPDFLYLPLSFDVTNEEGNILHFELSKIESKPVDNGAFRIPADHKVITNAEYRQLSGQ